MMATRRYTVEQLLHLRDSPLVKKPESLPAIEQWLEYVYLDVDGSREKLRIPHSEVQQQQRQSASGRQQRPVVDASPMGNFSTGQRPGLIQTRSTAAKSGGECYIHLRTSITNKTKDSYKTVYNWQYVHSLDFWSRVVAAHCESLREAAR